LYVCRRGIVNALNAGASAIELDDDVATKGLIKDFRDGSLFSVIWVQSHEKMEAKKHYFGLTYDNQLITRGIDTRRHDSPVFIKEFQRTLLSKLFNCQSSEEVLKTGYQNALEHINQNIDKLMNGEIQITDLIISKLLRQNIEKYRALFPHVSAAIRLNVSGVISKSLLIPIL
jgi:DNA polymerase elongation subunit (family B)